VPPPPPDLVVLLRDADARVRRRAALAAGRVGLAEGVPPLAALLAGDREPAVREMAAFALGLLGDRAAVAPLRAALADREPMVQGRAAEALSLIGDVESAGPIAAMVAPFAALPAVAAVPIDDVEESHEPPVEAFRLGVVALGRLKAYEPLAGAVLDASGQARVRWWPIAFALQRVEDRRALPALTAFARGDGSFGRAFAARGLGALKDPAGLSPLLSLAENWVRDTKAAITAVRALGQIGDPRAGPLLARLLQTRNLDPLLLIEVVAAAGATRAPETLDILLDRLADPSPAVRAAALKSVREIDGQDFMFVLSGLDPDRHWSVRAATATILGTMDRESALPLLTEMLADTDLRVVPAVLSAMGKLQAPGVAALLLERLAHDDVVIRAVAATQLGELRPPDAERALEGAYRLGARDALPVARVAALEALAKYGAAALPVLREAFADRDWSVRLKAAGLVRKLEPTADVSAIRPAPTAHPAEYYESAELVSPSISPQIYIDTDRGTIQVELAVLDAPLTCDHFVSLARRGFFNGLAWHRVVPNFVVQDGDPRGDGEGGSGRTIRDELNPRPFLRGTVGMALDGPDTGNSQYFITHSPQPHLDGRYTVFGRVVSGMAVVDQLQPGDTVRQVRVWDGKTMSQ
ncbi:MAG: hypothetical protein EHM24_26095, partial [Acidobacteria bacterium]